MIKIKEFSILEQEQKKRVCDFFYQHNSLIKKTELESYICSKLFCQGDMFLTLWQGDILKGTVGIVAGNIAIKNEAYLINIYTCEEHQKCLQRLLEVAQQKLKEHPKVHILLGLNTKLDLLLKAAKGFGLKEWDQTLIMKFCSDLNSVSIKEKYSKEKYRLELLNEENKEVFLSIHNRAFLDSPNSGVKELEDLEKVMAQELPAEFHGLLLYENVPVGMYGLKIELEVGWIEELGIDPLHQKKGMGTALLYNLLVILRNHRADQVKLIVMKSNFHAVSLYKKNDFVIEKVLNYWFEV